MRARSPGITVLAVALAPLLLVACHSHPTGPDAAGIMIRLEVSGGVAAADYAFEVDGAQGVVRGVYCHQLCQFQPGDVLASISAAQVSSLATRLEAAGILGLDGSDFGDQCCDQFHYLLTYRRGGATATLQGSSGALPADLQPLVGEIHNLGSEIQPLLVALGSRPEDWPGDPLGLDSIALSGATLTVETSYAGGCQAHNIGLVAYNGWLESFPVQVGVLIAHDARGDPCRALIRDRRTFDLTPLREAYEQAYGSGPATIVIDLRDPARPTAPRRLEFSF